MDFLKCPLCNAPYLAPDVPNCTHTPQENVEIIRLQSEHKRLQGIREAYIGSLPPLYRDYLKEIPADIEKRNPQVFADLDQMSERAFVFLHGEGGAGKSNLAVFLAAYLANKYRVSALFIGEEAYFERVEQSYGGGPAAPDLLAPQILVYDDAGKKPPSANASRLFYRMLEQRLSHMKATIITSNKSPELLAESASEYPEEVGSILTRLYAGWVYEIEGSADGNGRVGIAK